MRRSRLSIFGSTEAASGHNRFAYYIGKVLSTFPRMIVANLHFMILALLLSTPLIPFGIALLANFLSFYCVYGLASIISMIDVEKTVPLLPLFSASLWVSLVE
jgi:ABC-2 type transporter